MSLYIVLTKVRKYPSHEIEWHVGESNYISVIIDDIHYVQADGDELNYILRKITNIPMAQQGAIKWYGDHAKFIVGNLFHLREN